MKISELMEGKEPGSVKITCRGWGAYVYVRPFFKDNKGAWHCSDEYNISYRFEDWSERFSLYQEPAKTKTVYEWMIKEDRGEIWYVSDYLRTEEEACAEWPRAEHRKTGRQFEVPE